MLVPEESFVGLGITCQLNMHRYIHVGAWINCETSARTYPLPKREREISVRLSLKAIGQVERVRKVHGTGAKMSCKQLEISILIGVLKSNCNIGQPKIPTKLAAIGVRVGELLIIIREVIRVKLSPAMAGTR